MSKKTRIKKRKKRFYKRKGFWIFILVCMCLGGLSLFIADKMLDKYREQAAQYKLERINDLEVPSIIYGVRGKEIGRVFVENRSIIDRKAIPTNMIQALISGEDKRFRTHDGVDYTGIVRAFYLNWKMGKQTQGASTLTQQLARNAFNLKEAAKKNKQSSYERKLVEAFLAHRIEKRYSKDEILTFYLNRVPFGSGYYGIRSAALGYFGKEPSELETYECATLVGCIKNPSVYSPVKNPKKNKWSRDNVLRRMAEDGFIKSSEAEKMKKLPVLLNPKPLKRGTSHLYGRILAEIRSREGEEFLTEGGYKIYTTVDAELQKRTESELQKQLLKIEQRPDYLHQTYQNYRKSKDKTKSYLQGAALIVDNHTGEVRAYVGGRDYSHSQYDFIEQAKRPLGTAFLPFVYATAFGNGASPVTPVLDEAMDNRSVMVGGVEGILGEWGMERVDPFYEGSMTARKALASSKIAATMRLGRDVGLEKVKAVAGQFGLPFESDSLLPRMILGWEPVSLPAVVHAYATIANLGETPPALTILERIESSNGDVIYRVEKQDSTRKIMDESTAYQLHSVLDDVGRRGNLEGFHDSLGNRTFNGVVKTGTTHNFADNWAVGYTNKLTCAMWTGFLDRGNKPIYDMAFAKDTLLPAWKTVMLSAEVNYLGEKYSLPAGLEPVDVCSVSGGRATRFCYKEVVDEIEGNTQFTSTTYTDYLREKKDSLSYCHVHGAGVSGLARLLEDFSPDKAPENEKILITVPIRPKGLPLIGEDPYRSQMPDLVDTSHTPKASSGISFNFDGIVPGEEDARLQLRAPDRLKILID